jgi:uncharacterized protein
MKKNDVIGGNSQAPKTSADSAEALSRRTLLKATGVLALGSLAGAAVPGCDDSDGAGPTLHTTFIADAVSHGYNYTPENSYDQALGAMFGDYLYDQVHVALQPDEPQWRLTKARFIDAVDPDLVGSALFRESPTDFTVYHEVPFFGLFKDGSSSIEVGKAMREQYGPDRVAIYGGVSALQPDVMAQLDRLEATPGVVGLKLYPGDVINGKFQPSLMSDTAATFKVIERAQSIGLKSIAVHKATVIGPIDPASFNVTDVTAAAKAFPDMNFEIVHGGLAFLPETLAVLQACPNVFINLEGPSSLVIRQSDAFAQIMAAFLSVDPQAERLIWSTGCMLVHPRPFLDAFWAFQFPQRMIDDGTPALTLQMKQRILGGNLAKLISIPRSQQARLVASKTSNYAMPWSGGRA